jgi:hypothetical protein
VPASETVPSTANAVIDDPNSAFGDTLKRGPPMTAMTPHE